MKITKIKAPKAVSVLVILALALGGWLWYSNYQNNRGNIVQNKQLASQDLVSFLRNYNTKCPKTSDGKTGYYKVVNEVNDSFAYLNYGCANDPQALAGDFTQYAAKNNDKWSFIGAGDSYSDGTYLNCSVVDQVKFLKDSLKKCISSTYVPATPPPHEHTDTWKYTIQNVKP